MGPTQTVDHDNDRALADRQLREGGSESRLDEMCSLFDANEHDRFVTNRPSSPQTLPHAVHVSVRVFHDTHPVPVLPGIGKRFGSCLTTDLESVSGAEGEADRALSTGEELLKSSWADSPPPSLLSPTKARNG